jgi:hypothetical protein
LQWWLLLLDKILPPLIKYEGEAYGLYVGRSSKALFRMPGPGDPPLCILAANYVITGKVLPNPVIICIVALSKEKEKQRGESSRMVRNLTFRKGEHVQTTERICNNAVILYLDALRLKAIGLVWMVGSRNMPQDISTVMN